MQLKLIRFSDLNSEKTTFVKASHSKQKSSIVSEQPVKCSLPLESSSDSWVKNPPSETCRSAAMSVSPLIESLSTKQIIDSLPSLSQSPSSTQNPTTLSLPSASSNRLIEKSETIATLSSDGRKSLPEEKTSDNVQSSATDHNLPLSRLEMEPEPKAGMVHPQGYKTNPPPTGRPVRIYADGVFDLFHYGHMRQLQQAKTAFTEVYLIVGVTGDEETLRHKGLTVLSAKERAESVRHCKWVDEVVEDCPWIVSDAPGFMEKYEIDYVAHDDIPYESKGDEDIYAPIKRQGKFLVTQRTEGLSTTGIITKIVRDYEKYISRQLKRGTPRQELNVSWLKKNEIDIKDAVGEIRNNILTNWTMTGQELGKELRQLWQLPGNGHSHDSGNSKSAGSTKTG